MGVKGDQMERKFTDVFAKLGLTMLRTILIEYRKVSVGQRAYNEHVNENRLSS